MMRQHTASANWLCIATTSGVSSTVQYRLMPAAIAATYAYTIRPNER
jgi:hypothetical protein